MRYLPTILAALALAGAVWWLVGVLRERDRLAAELRAAEVELVTRDAALAQAREAARVHRAYLDRLESQRAEWAAIEAELQTMEGRDAPLSPLLRATAERLWQ